MTIRPRFKDGVRLTAPQLNEVVEYLRSQLRRFALAPFSPGVGAGLLLSPDPPPVHNTTLQIAPGVAIDGRGRILVLPVGKTYRMDGTGPIYTLVDVSAPAVPVLQLTARDVFVVRLEAVESDQTGGETPCAPGTFGVVENVRVVFDRVDDLQETFSAYLQLLSEGCVDPWSELDPPGGAGETCGVQLGVVGLPPGDATLTPSNFFRQGVSARLSVVRSAFDVPSVLLGRLPVGATTIDAVVFNVPAGGPVVQASHVGAFARPYGAGSFASTDDRVFTFPGGTGSDDRALAAGFGGLASVPCESSSPAGSITGAGQPLYFDDGAPEGSAVVRAHAPGIPNSLILGLSASAAYSVDGKVVVPVAVAGLLRARVVNVSPGEVPPGTELTVAPSGTLIEATTGQRVVARLAHKFGVGAGPALVWVTGLGYR